MYVVSDTSHLHPCWFNLLQIKNMMSLFDLWHRLCDVPSGSKLWQSHK